MDLWSFLLSKGVSLEDFGSSARGLRKQDAIAFLRLLGTTRHKPLGLEVWRRDREGYRIDSLAIWYEESRSGVDAFSDAENFLDATSMADDDLVTVQF